MNVNAKSWGNEMGAADKRSMSNSDRALLASFQSEADTVLVDAMGDLPDEVAVLDFPRHQNAGDTLIWRGEMTQLDRMGVRVAYVADIGRYNQAEMDRRVPSGPILLHGGGNFGDVWPQFQDEREQVVLRNPNRRIVCLPQSLKFSSPQRAARTNEIFAAHGGVTVLARDHTSVDHARHWLPDVDIRFSRDAALGNKPVEVPAAPVTGLLVLQRKDLESNGRLSGYQEFDHQIADWGLTGVAAARWYLNRAPLAAYKRLPSIGRRVLQPVVDRRYTNFVRLNMESAEALVARGRVLVTDRLHAHVLACLMGIPNIVLDNNYGKIRPIFNEYTGQFSTAHFANSSLEVRQILGQLMEGPKIASTAT